MFNSDRIAAILVCAIVLIFVFQFSDIPSTYSRIFPKYIAWATVALCAILFIQSWINPTILEFAKAQELKKVGISVLLLFGWVVFVKFLGFYLSSVLFFTLIMILIEPSTLKLDKLAASIFVAAAEIGVFYLVFTKWLNVPLPKGLFFQ